MSVATIRGSDRSQWPAPWMIRSSAGPFAAATSSRAASTGTSRSSAPCTTRIRRGGSRAIADDRVERVHALRERVGVLEGRRPVDGAGREHRRVEAVGRAGPRDEVDGRRERRDAADPLVVRRVLEDERAAEPEPPEPQPRVRSGEVVDDRGEVVAPPRRTERALRVPDARQRARRDRPARLLGQVLGELGQRPVGGPAAAAREGQPVADEQAALLVRPRRGRRHEQRQRPQGAEDLLADRHAPPARCRVAGRAARGGRRDRRTAARSSSPA